jgi:archaemetzincin
MTAMARKLAIVLAPIGDVPTDLLEQIAGQLTGIFNLACPVAAMIPKATRAYDGRRGQYLGDRILAMLARLDMPDAERVLGVIDADCYAPGLNFIFGQASIHGRDAFIALPRLRPSFYGLPDNEVLFSERTLKEAVHELGHTYGLKHCPDRRCVMHFSNSLYDTDVKSQQFCRRCRARLDQAMGTK